MTMPAVETLLPLSGGGLGVGVVEAAELAFADDIADVAFELVRFAVELELDDIADEDEEAERVEVDKVVLVDEELDEIFGAPMDDCVLLADADVDVAGAVLGFSDVVAGVSDEVTTGVVTTSDACVVGCAVIDVGWSSEVVGVVCCSAFEVVPGSKPDVNGSSRLLTPLTRGSRKDMICH